MYGKIHQSFFDSSINDADPMTRLVFIGMVTLSDQSGKLDITRESLSRRLNLPKQDVDHAIDVLSAPDDLSRSPELDGRRIVPVDPARSWGWVVVNKSIYRHTREEERREQAAERKRQQRARERSAGKTSEKEESKETDTDTYTGHHARSRSSHALSRSERDSLFEDTWERVPRKFGKKLARRAFEARVKTAEDAAQVARGVENYREKVRLEGTTHKYTLYGSTLLSDIDDYIALDFSSMRPPDREEGPGGVAI